MIPWDAKQAALELLPDHREVSLSRAEAGAWGSIEGAKSGSKRAVPGPFQGRNARTLF